MIDRRTVIVSLLVALFALALPHPALAAPIIVGDGTPVSCTEAAVRAALAVAEASGGGTIQFKCGTLPTTIMFPNEFLGGTVLVLPGDTVVDGGGLITFVGNLDGPLVVVPTDTNVVLKKLTIANLSLSFCIVNHGTLSVENSIVSGNLGGGIANGGILIVERSTFSENGGFNNSAISNGGELSVKNSLFFNNDGFEAGAISNFGSATIKAAPSCRTVPRAPAASGMTAR
jgi:hypothetical protein